LKIFQGRTTFLNETPEVDQVSGSSSLVKRSWILVWLGRRARVEHGICRYCGKSMNSPTELREHERQHTEEEQQGSLRGQRREEEP